MPVPESVSSILPQALTYSMAAANRPYYPVAYPQFAA